MIHKLRSYTFPHTFSMLFVLSPIPFAWKRSQSLCCAILLCHLILPISFRYLICRIVYSKTLDVFGIIFWNYILILFFEIIFRNYIFHSIVADFYGISLCLSANLLLWLLIWLHFQLVQVQWILLFADSPLYF